MKDIYHPDRACRVSPEEAQRAAVRTTSVYDRPASEDRVPTKKGVRRERFITVLPTRQTCEDRAVVFATTAWARVVAIARVGGFKLDEQTLTPSGSRTLYHALSETGLTVADADERKTYEKLLALLKTGRGLKVGWVWADETHLSVGR